MGRYMMATTAIHTLGDISRDDPDLCVIDREESDDYIGRWVEGFGFEEVRFPKSTTRELTPEETAHYDGMILALGGMGFALGGEPHTYLGQVYITDPPEDTQ